MKPSSCITSDQIPAITALVLPSDHSSSDMTDRPAGLFFCIPQSQDCTALTDDPTHSPSLLSVRGVQAARLFPVDPAGQADISAQLIKDTVSLPSINI